MLNREPIIEYMKQNPKSTNTEIAKIFNHDRHIISDIRKKAGIKPAVIYKILEQTKKEIADLFSNKIYTKKELEELYGLTKTSINKVLKEKGVYVSFAGKSKVEFSKKSLNTLYKKHKSWEKVAESLGISNKTVLNYRKKLDFSVNNYRIPKKTKEYVLSQRGKKTSKKIAEEIGKTRGIITKIWYDHNLPEIKHKSYFFNEDYFEKINTPNKAYFVGFIAADGCIYNRNNNSQKWLALTINKKDIELIVALKNEIGLKKPMQHDNKNHVGIHVISDKLCDDLSKYNIIERKTWTFVPKNIPKEFRWDFMKGYFDGDGTISGNKITAINRNNPSQYLINIVGNEKTMNYFGDFLLNENINGFSVKQDLREDKYSHPFFGIYLNNSTSKYVFAKKYISSKSFFLKRKRNRMWILTDAIERNLSNRAENKKAIQFWENWYRKNG